MKIQALAALCLVPLALARAPKVPKCNKDNCARAILGGRKGDVQAAVAQADCSSFLQSTPTPGVKQVIPMYAKACRLVSKYSSACSCFGQVTQTTVVVTSTKAPVALTSSAALSTTEAAVSSTVEAAVSSTAEAATSSSVEAATSSTVEAVASSSIEATSSSTVEIAASSTVEAAVSSTAVASAVGSASASSTLTYSPVIPTSYAACNLDPNNAAQALELIMADTGVSFINIENDAILAMNQVEGLTELFFRPTTNGPFGVFDLVDNLGQFLALYADGHMGFESASSNGQVPVANLAGATYITSLWVVACDGTVSLGLIGGSEYKLALGADGLSLFGFPSSYTPTKRGTFGFIDFLIFVKELLVIRTTLEIDDPRCEDPAKKALDKFGTSPSANGCGSGPFVFNHVPFVECCNTHDRCFDDCNDTFLNCNAVFATCTYDTATAAYPGSDMMSRVSKLGYQRLAAIFAYIVESEIGRIVFDIANKARCDCCTVPKEVSCSTGCSDPMTDKQNCGACGVVCPVDSVCENGVCSDTACPAAVCGSYTPCNGNSGCQCYTTASGTGYCTGDQYCAGLADCGSNADCGGGSICAVGSCCGRNVCLPINCQAPGQAVLKALMGGHEGEASSSNLGVKGRFRKH